MSAGKRRGTSCSCQQPRVTAPLQSSQNTNETTRPITVHPADDAEDA
jgi:hypothetical protein